MANHEHNHHDSQQDDHAGNQQAEPGSRDIRHKGGTGRHADRGEEYGEAEVAHDDVGDDGHIPVERAQPSDVAEDQSNHERAAGNAKLDTAEPGDRDWNEADQRASSNAETERDEAEISLSLD